VAGNNSTNIVMIDKREERDRNRIRVN